MRETQEEREALWIRESARLNRRYVSEVIVAFGLCPYAKGAVEAGQVDQAVLLQADASTKPALEHLERWSREARVEIGLLIFPRVPLGRPDFQRFANAVIEADRERCGRSSSPFALAAFHPDAAFDTSSADRLVPFLRRTPDPTLQVVRVSALARVRGDESAGTQFADPRTFNAASFAPPGPSLRDRIAAHNLRTVIERKAELMARLNDIEDDHRRTRKLLQKSAPLSDTDAEPPS